MTGEIPESDMKEFLTKIIPTKRILRKGIVCDLDVKYSILHALGNASFCYFWGFIFITAESCNMFEENANRFDFVRNLAQELVESCPKWIQNTSYAEIFSLKYDVNVIVFIFSYTRADDIRVVFSGNRYDKTQRSIVLIQTMENVYEPICFDGETLICNDTQTQFQKLFEAFCPQEHQNMFRLEFLVNIYQSDNICQVIDDSLKYVVGVYIDEHYFPMVLGSPFKNVPQFKKLEPQAFVKHENCKQKKKIVNFFIC